MATDNMYKHLVEFARVDFELCDQTDRQTDNVLHNTSHPSRERSNKSNQWSVSLCSFSCRHFQMSVATECMALGGVCRVRDVVMFCLSSR